MKEFLGSPEVKKPKTFSSRTDSRNHGTVKIQNSRRLAQMAVVSDMNENMSR